MHVSSDATLELWGAERGADGTEPGPITPAQAATRARRRAEKNIASNVMFPLWLDSGHWRAQPERLADAAALSAAAVCAPLAGSFAGRGIARPSLSAC